MTELDEIEKLLGEGLGLVKYDQPEDYEMTPFGGMWVSEDGKSGRNLKSLAKKVQALIDKRETAARIDEFQKMIKMQEDYEARLKADREKGIYPVSFGSANGAIANAGWLNYFRDRIKALSAKHSSKEDVNE